MTARLPADTVAVLRVMRDQRDPRLNATLRRAVDLGWPQMELARSLDVSKQAVHQRVNNPGDADPFPIIPNPPPPPSNPQPSSRPNVDENTAEELRQLHELCGRSGVSPAGSPAPAARRRLVDILNRLHCQEGIPVRVIARAMRVPPKSVWNRLAKRRHSPT